MMQIQRCMAGGVSYTWYAEKGLVVRLWGVWQRGVLYTVSLPCSWSTAYNSTNFSLNAVMLAIHGLYPFSVRLRFPVEDCGICKTKESAVGTIIISRSIGHFTWAFWGHQGGRISFRQERSILCLERQRVHYKNHPQPFSVCIMSY